MNLIFLLLFYTMGREKAIFCFCTGLNLEGKLLCRKAFVSGVSGLSGISGLSGRCGADAARFYMGLCTNLWESFRKDFIPALTGPSGQLPPGEAWLLSDFLICTVILSSVSLICALHHLSKLGKVVPGSTLCGFLKCDLNGSCREI